jgi:hypothetical protein
MDVGRRHRRQVRFEVLDGLVGHIGQQVGGAGGETLGLDAGFGQSVERRDAHRRDVGVVDAPSPHCLQSVDQAAEGRLPLRRQRVRHRRHGGELVAAGIVGRPGRVRVATLLAQAAVQFPVQHAGEHGRRRAVAHHRVKDDAALLADEVRRCGRQRG